LLAQAGNVNGSGRVQMHSCEGFCKAKHESSRHHHYMRRKLPAESMCTRYSCEEFAGLTIVDSCERINIELTIFAASFSKHLPKSPLDKTANTN
jgi:hypothetical protein